MTHSRSLQGVVNPAVALWVFLLLGVVPVVQAGDEEALRRRIEVLEHELREERERSARERAAQRERFSALESKIEALRTGSDSSPSLQTSAATQERPGDFNPAVSAVGNFVFRGSDSKIRTDDGDRIENRPHLREMELDLRAAVDPYADAVFIAALESEAPGEFEAGVEEGYLNVKHLPFLDRLPLGLQLKLGRFRPHFGRINLLHTHDLPQSDRPLVIQEFLGEEGFVGDGVSGQIYLPTPWDDEAAMDLTFQALTGDLASASSGRSDHEFLGHLRWFRTFADTHTLEIGGSGLYSRNESPRFENWVVGGDWLYRWKPLRGGQSHSFLLGGEVLWADREFEWVGGEDGVGEETIRRRTNPFGAYFFAQYQPAARWYFGVRGDVTDTIDDTSSQRRGVTPYVSYYFSEFLRFRLNYEHLWSDIGEEDGRNAVILEGTFIFGAHPPEPFWVNK